MHLYFDAGKKRMKIIKCQLTSISIRVSWRFELSSLKIKQ